MTPGGTQFEISGINWYGFETKAYIAHGMCCQDYTYILNEIKQYGYNTIRIPFSNEMWENDPKPGANYVSACSACTGKHSRDILALIINYAGSIGLHVILDNHRSEAGNSAESNGLWYYSGYTEQNWINDWVNIQHWVHGQKMTQGSTDTVAVNDTASDGYPTVIGFDLRNEPHTPSRTAYLSGASWGSGDGISPSVNPNPNPFTPSCVSNSSCHDWRLAAERAGDTILGDAATNGWSYPLIFVEGVSQYPTASGTMASGPYDYYWWGGELQGVNANSGNPGAPVVLNAGGNASSLGAAVSNQLVYSAHDYGPSEYAQSWFNTSTCYTKGCSSSSLADLWVNHWAYLDLSGGVNPVWPGHASYLWSNTGTTAYSQTPVWMGEFGTGNASGDLYTGGAGSQGQWFTDLINFLQSSRNLTTANDSGYALSNLNWTYWALNTEDSYALLGTSWTGLAYPPKEYSFLCFIQSGPLAVPQGSASNQCGNTGALPAAS